MGCVSSKSCLKYKLRSCCADLNNVKIAPVPYARVCKKQEGKASPWLGKASPWLGKPSPWLGKASLT